MPPVARTRPITWGASVGLIVEPGQERRQGIGGRQGRDVLGRKIDVRRPHALIAPAASRRECQAPPPLIPRRPLPANSHPIIPDRTAGASPRRSGDACPQGSTAATPKISQAAIQEGWDEPHSSSLVTAPTCSPCTIVMIGQMIDAHQDHPECEGEDDVDAKEMAGGEVLEQPSRGILRFGGDDPHAASALRVSGAGVPKRRDGASDGIPRYASAISPTSSAATVHPGGGVEDLGDEQPGRLVRHQLDELTLPC
jgi:hypothetical protein